MELESTCDIGLNSLNSWVVSGFHRLCSNKLSWAFFLLSLSSGITLAQAQSLTLDEVLQKAIAASPDLKIAQTDIGISKTDIMAARSDYFPNIQSRLNTEYLKDLEGGIRPVVSVGNTVIPAGTRYQNSVGITLNQKLYDFGARKKRVEMAQKDVLTKAAVYDQSLRDLKVRLVDLYTKALISFREIKANEAILTLAQQGYQMKKRLNGAGSVDQVAVATEAIQVAQAMDDIETLKHELEQNIQNISFFTQESYNTAELELSDMHEDTAQPTVQMNLQTAPEARAYDAQIDQKQKEVEYLQKQYLPQVFMYSNYNMYGFDPEQFGRSLKDLSQRTVSVGLSVNMPMFDGFKNKAAIQKAKLEKEKLVLQKTKALLELKHQADTLEQLVETHGVLLKTKATILNKTQDKLSMETRLSEKQLVDKTRAIQDHIARIRVQLDTEKSLIESIASLKKLRILEAGT